MAGKSRGKQPRLGGFSSRPPDSRPPDSRHGHDGTGNRPHDSGRGRGSHSSRPQDSGRGCGSHSSRPQDSGRGPDGHSSRGPDGHSSGPHDSGRGDGSPVDRAHDSSPSSAHHGERQGRTRLTPLSTTEARHIGHGYTGSNSIGGHSDPAGDMHGVFRRYNAHGGIDPEDESDDDDHDAQRDSNVVVTPLYGERPYIERIGNKCNPQR
ncbi:hypothetical protein L2E82_37542 [Cichorium intybus]|uniref:Uncharacterized protein n=1 Tax=Cichorium intybus TaxID=13427 RepID=A0ACB9ADS9_CICIN|nr:hypothetical protein L2E82_37542 [Cichorium intybus]